MNNKMHLGYWNGTWRGQPIRLLLEYLELPYEETRYKWETANLWYKDHKQNLGLNFPNLPYLLDGQKSLTECETIAHYVAIKGNAPELNGKDEDFYIVQQVKGIVSGLMDKAWYANEKNPEQKQKDLDDCIFYQLSKLLGYLSNKDWVLGYLSVADFFLYCISKNMQHMFPSEFTKVYGDSFNAFWQRFENLPRISQYMASERYVKYEMKKE